MEDYRRQGGIQQLLVAEQEARQIVNAARTAKMNRLKQAKDEAEEEVTKYREQMEKEYQKTISESTGFSGTNVKRLDDETATKIDKLKKQAAKVSPEVIKLLMTQVTVVKLGDETASNIYHLKRQAAKLSAEVMRILMTEVTTVKV